MKILIEIECDAIHEIRSHIRVIREQLRKAQNKSNLDDFDDLPDVTVFKDSNCYGTHELIVVNP